MLRPCHGVHGQYHVLMGWVASRNKEGLLHAGTALAPSCIVKRTVGLARQSLPGQMAMCIIGVPVQQ